MSTVRAGSRARTRQAIIEAAIEVLSRNPAASLGDVAAAADVGRTTLHRYFPERSDLLSALRTEALDRLEQARARARTTEDTGSAAVRRLCQEYFDLGDLLSLLFHEQIALEDEEDPAGSDAWFEELVQRGHADGTIDPELPAVWVQSLIWSQLYVGWSFLAENNPSRHETLRLLLRCVEGAIRPLR
ncbi:helix-turn-helix domain-containing protein [Actinoplanes sp. NPDC024001]|uniref:TetR/AcrR family transcriptional regulator n=1 Tax=Actinoplanes sp. NPDC024001 TaxID=3154598 RepID=UPI0033C73996